MTRAPASAQVASDPTTSDRRLVYTTPQGTHVLVALYGAGSLAGSTVDPSDGALNLVYDGTNENSAIVSHVHGGTRQAPLQSIRNANVALNDLSGIGGTVLFGVKLGNFDLVTNGQINLTSGVNTLLLNSVAPNTQINLRTLPAALTTQTPATNANTSVSLEYTPDVGTATSDARTLTGVSGDFVPAPNLTTLDFISVLDGVMNPNAPPAPPGVVISINSVNGTPRSPAALGDPEVFGLDPTAQALIGFDAATGAIVQTIPLPGPMTAGVGLAHDDGSLVALVSDGSTIYAFNALTGNPAGQFTTTNLLDQVDGIGSTGSYDGIGSVDSFAVLARTRA